MKNKKIFTYEDFTTKEEMEQFQIDKDGIEFVGVETFMEERWIEKKDYKKVTKDQYWGEKKLVEVIRLIYKKTVSV